MQSVSLRLFTANDRTCKVLPRESWRENQEEPFSRQFLSTGFPEMVWISIDGGREETPSRRTPSRSITESFREESRRQPEMNNVFVLEEMATL